MSGSLSAELRTTLLLMTLLVTSNRPAQAQYSEGYLPPGEYRIIVKASARTVPQTIWVIA